MKLRALLLLAAAAFLGSSLHAASTVLFSNVSATIPAETGGILGGGSGCSCGGQYDASAFEFTPTTTAAFIDARIDLWATTSTSGSDASVSAALYSNSTSAGSGDTPGVLLAQLETTTAPIFPSIPMVPFSSINTSFTQTSGPALTLVAGTKYWLVLTPGDASSLVFYAVGGATADAPQAYKFPAQNSAWTFSGPDNVQFEIDGTEQACSYSFPGSPASAAAGASVGSAALTATCAYGNVVSNNPDWIGITSGSAGSGSGSIGYSVAANNSGGARTGSFTVLDDNLDNNGDAVANFIINQAAASCTSLTLSPTVFTFGMEGGSGTVNFNTSPCAWTVSGAPSWVGLPVSSGNGSSFNFTIQPNNSGGTLNATLSVNNGALTVAIAQTGLICTYTIVDASGFGAVRGFTSSGGGGGFSVKAPPNCPWTATSSSSFITISGSAAGSGNGSIQYSVAANPGSNAQSGTITVQGAAYTINELPPAAQSFSCFVGRPLPLDIRAEGFAEPVADLLMTCSGQAPVGGITGDIVVGFNAGISNRLLSAGYTDILLLEDEPTSQNLALGTNVFRGLTSFELSNTVLFPSVQFASAGGGNFSHTWRITNARVDAEFAAQGPLPAAVDSFIAISSAVPATIDNPQQTVAMALAGSTFSLSASSAGPNPGQTIQPVSFNEGFPSAFRPLLAAGQDPSQVGTVYNAESGYVNSHVLGTQTGFAASGARLIAAVANVPADVNVYAPVGPAAGTNAELVSADGTGAGGFPLPGLVVFGGIAYEPLGGSGTATWEVTASNAATLESFTFNLLLDNPNGVSLAGITYSGSLAPVQAGAAARLPNTNAPVPRFLSSKISVPAQSTVNLSVAPVPQAVTGQGGASQKSQAAAIAAPSANNVVGGTISFTLIAANNGATTAPNAVAGGTLPPTFVLTGCTIVDTQSSCLDPALPANQFSATYPSLSSGQTATITVTAESAGQTSGDVEVDATIYSDLANAGGSESSFTQNFPVASIGLSVSLQHASNFTTGQTGAIYTATVTNGGSIPTSDPVTLTETLPASLTLVSMAGGGWTCTLSTASCTRSDPLAANSSFPSIAIAVNVASNAPSTVTNQVIATTGVLQATGSDPTNITQGTVAPAAFFTGEDSLGSGVYYLQFPNGNLFGYYNLQSFPILYHYDMGFEAFVDGGNGAAYLYDFSSGHWFYTSSSLFPYLYDFTLNTWLYYFPATNNPGHYASDPRYFSNLTTGKIFTM
jgi:uncharacterized repeat protein (TIGR01451 family)